MSEPIYDTDLKPCPFCGSPAHIVWGAKRRVYGSQETVEGACVYCETCNAEMFSTSKHLIAEMWNRRADDDKLHEYDKALKTMGDLNDGQSEKIAKLKAQLRAQEPRVLTLEELQVWQEAIWFEEHDDEPFIALISNYDPTYAELSVVDVDAYRRETNHDLRIYNKWWRCWTSRPTDEQMEAVPWTE